MMSALLRSIVLCLCLPAPIALAETRTTPNAFFGFEYFLTPIAIKWSCGGHNEGDLAAIDALISLQPEDAAEAELKSVVELLLDASMRPGGIDEILGFATTPDQRKQLCASALPLELSDFLPEHATHLTVDDLNVLRTEWSRFFTVIEEWQTKATP